MVTLSAYGREGASKRFFLAVPVLRGKVPATSDQGFSSVRRHESLPLNDGPSRPGPSWSGRQKKTISLFCFRYVRELGRFRTRPLCTSPGPLVFLAAPHGPDVADKDTAHADRHVAIICIFPRFVMMLHNKLQGGGCATVL